jgi:hypothetical protein
MGFASAHSLYIAACCASSYNTGTRASVFVRLSFPIECIARDW